MASNTTSDVSSAIAAAGLALGFDLATLEANPTIKAQIQALVEAKQLAVAASVTPASTATASTHPLPP